jgi:hypothetical protein
MNVNAGNSVIGPGSPSAGVIEREAFQNHQSFGTSPRSADRTTRNSPRLPITVTKTAPRAASATFARSAVRAGSSPSVAQNAADPSMAARVGIARLYATAGGTPVAFASVATSTKPR